MKLSRKEKKEIAKMAVEKSYAIENGQITVWRTPQGFSILEGSHEYREQGFTYLFRFNIQNEGHPYRQKDFLAQIEFYSYE